MCRGSLWHRETTPGSGTHTWGESESKSAVDKGEKLGGFIWVMSEVLEENWLIGQ